MITIFPSLFKKNSPTSIPIETALNRIRSGTDYTRGIIERLRATTDPKQIKEIKESLPVYCWSGEFSQRNAESCQKHSGLICLDFDDETKERIISNPYVYIAFTSPTGTGVKAIVRIPPIIDQHERHFKELQKYFNLPTLDHGGDLPRACFDSIDPELYINESAPVFIAEEGDELVRDVAKTYFPVSDSSEIIRRIHTWLERRERFGEGNRNKYVHSFVSAMNRYGVERSEAESHAMQYVQDDFSEREIQAIVKSAYSKTADFGKAVFENVRLLNDFKVQKQAGQSDEVLIENAKANGLKPKDAAQLIQSLDKGKEINKFWTIVQKPNDKIEIGFDFQFMFGWLHQRGFYRYRISPGNIILVRRINNVVHIIEKAHIIDEVNQYLLGLVRDDPKVKPVYQAFVSRARSIMHNEQLLFLDYVDPDWVQDTYNAGFLFFQNIAVRVTKQTIEKIEYAELPGCIWASQIIPRDLIISDDIECEYSEFLAYVSTGQKYPNEETQSNYFSICSLAGFLMHNYKDRGKPQAAILTDEIISDFAEGGTGKGIFVRAIGHLKNLVFIDGKNFVFDKNFLWQRVDVDSQIIWLDDVKQEFNFERLFSVLTEGIEVEKKNKTPFFIPFERSPRFVITTNYTVKGNGNSSNRRRFEIEFKQFFNKDNTPHQVFGHNLFDDWSIEEWVKFDNFMLYCLKYYLKFGLIASENKNLSYKKVLNATCPEFLDWASDHVIPGEWVKADLHDQFVSGNKDFEKTKTRTVTRWIEVYCNYKGWNYEHLQRLGSRRIKINE